MKKFIMMGVLMSLAVIATACGNKTQTEDGGQITSISIEKNGSIENTIVEDFSQSYYELDSLSAMIEQDIEAYHNQNPDSKISLSKCELTDDNSTVRVVMKYGDSQTYTEFNGETLFSGTVQDAYSAGYNLDMTLDEVKKGEKTGNSISRDDILGMGESHILIIEKPSDEEKAQEKIAVKCFGDIEFVGAGVEPTGKKSANMSWTQDYCVVIFK